MFTTGEMYVKVNSFQVSNGRALCEKYLPDLTPDDDVLDIGCGTGETTQYLAKKSGAKVIGIDVNPDMIKYAKLNNYHENVCYEVVDAQVNIFFLFFPV